MDSNDYYDDLQELIKELDIKITDQTKPAELFDAVIKLMATHASRQPDSDEIAENIKRKLRKDMESYKLSRGI